ncbi:hypothetical protein [Niallia sp. FSL R7-0271]|uniref:hypothetical protein n=1 Tax=Niallia sp. FSL R7-0271 TaxID=2921678 RepID=UPI0030F8E0FB
MNKEDKLSAEKLLKYLFIGATVEGISFYGPKLLLTESETNSKRLGDGQIYITIESEFAILQSKADTLPVFDDLPKRNAKDACKILCELSLMKIADVSLHDEIPHLLLTFETGEVLFICGHDNMYESWQAGFFGDSDGEYWEIVACPGDELAIWGPDDIG